jgi:hypothetical protein
MSDYKNKYLLDFIIKIKSAVICKIFDIGTIISGAARAIFKLPAKRFFGL